MALKVEECSMSTSSHCTFEDIQTSADNVHESPQLRRTKWLPAARSQLLRMLWKTQFAGHESLKVTWITIMSYCLAPQRIAQEESQAALAVPGSVRLAPRTIPAHVIG